MYDSPWKEALETYFPAFLAFFFPEAHEGIDWTQGYSFLDKELQQLDPKSERGARIVDKLVEIRRRGGDQALILVHVEVQAQTDAGFERRMFVYHYRIFDRYKRKVVSLAVLADERPAWHPASFGYALWGCRLKLEFPAVKLLDYAWDDLEASRNPFAFLVQAHIKTQATRNVPKDRLRWKLALTKTLYQKGHSRDEIVSLFRFVDWMMALPDGLDQQFDDQLADFEEVKKMPYVTGIERRAITKGREEGRLQMAHQSVVEALEIRFGSVPDATRNAIHEITDVDQTRELYKAAIQAESFDAFERLLDIRGSS